jgi:glutamate-5-semialdehyde dehydrogenase
MSAAPANVAELGSRLAASRAAAPTLRGATAAAKNGALLELARSLEAGSAGILRANAEDLAALPASATAAFRDRLALDAARLASMSESLRQVAALADPVGEIVERRTLSNGLQTARERVPLGVILMIFESRPNVAVEAFSLGFKAGNAMILRGGKESARTAAALYALVEAALVSAGLPRACVWGITDPDRAISSWLLGRTGEIDVVVPRGGDSLIEFVTGNTRIPVIKNDRGLCHVYVHEDADLAMAEAIVENAKCQRPGVCNAMETLLVHRSVAPALLPRLHARLAQVRWHGCAETLAILAGRARVEPATEASFDTEYLDLDLNSRVVGGLDEALAHIARHGSRHSEAILTASEKTARQFQSSVDAAAVYWNASTRFTDGFALGLGGELGISTQKLHVRGPVGLRELTSVRWVIDGKGQVR